MFFGAAALNLDAKGRLAIPARHRDALVAAGEGRLIVTAHPHGCLLLYPEPAFLPTRDQIARASSLEKHTALLKRLIVGFMRDETLDATGRLLVAPELRQFARLDKQVWLVGQGDHFEIWSDEGWQKQQQEIFALGDGLLPPGFEGLSL